MKRRIIRADALNWAIQEYQTGGDTIDRGRYAGQTRQAKWKQPEAFYPRLRDAAVDMANEIIGDAAQGEIALTGQQLVVAIELAEKRTREYVNSLFQAQKDDLLIGILQERGYTVTTGKKGRTSYVEDEAGEGSEEG